MIDTLSQTTIIRKATPEDIEGAIDLLKEFQEESLAEYGVQVNIEIAKNFIKSFVDNSFVAKVDNKIVGVISGNIVTYPLDGSQVYQEAVWFVSRPYRRYGLLLLNKVEEMCKERGIRHLIMAHIGNKISEKIENFYIKKGFKKLETHYIREIC